jgi:uncharacterized protein (TIGR02466 family)
MEKMIITALFPTAVGCFKFDEPFTKIEMEFIDGLEKKPNMLNRISVETYILNAEPLQKLKTVLEEKLVEYFNALHKPRDDVKIVITQSWANYTTKGQGHHVHRHPNSFISGVLYIKTNENKDKIKFHNNKNSQIQIEPTEWNIFNSKTWMLEVNENELYLFPSELVHEVPTTEGDAERISISFNTFLVGQLGDERASNGLTITGVVT